MSDGETGKHGVYYEQSIALSQIPGTSQIQKGQAVVPHEDGLADLARTLQDACEERYTEVESKAPPQHEIQVGSSWLGPCGGGLGLLLLDFTGPFLQKAICDPLDVVVLGELVKVCFHDGLTLLCEHRCREKGGCRHGGINNECRERGSVWVGVCMHADQIHAPFSLTLSFFVLLYFPTAKVQAVRVVRRAGRKIEAASRRYPTLDQQWLNPVE